MQPTPWRLAKKGQLNKLISSLFRHHRYFSLSVLRARSRCHQERYTCPSLALHPLDDCFVAQTNGNYVAVFSSQRPYRMNKRRRYEGHKVGGDSLQDFLCYIIKGMSSEVSKVGLGEGVKRDFFFLSHE